MGSAHHGVDSPFGDLLRPLRRAAGLTQEELAERARLSVRGLSDLERGINRYPRRETVLALADALQLAPEERAALQAAARRPLPATQSSTRSPEPGGGADPTTAHSPASLPGDDARPSGDSAHSMFGAAGVAAASSLPPATLPVQTFLIGDMRGYTHFTLEHGDEAAARLAARFAVLAREVVAAHGGWVVELRGDEALCVFASTRQALRAAVELQSRFAAESAADPTLPLAVGMGLDAGEAIPLEGGYRGAALNLAARLCALAGPGEVLASEAVVHLARRVEGLAYRERAPVRLKGFAEPVRLHQVVPAAQPTPPALADTVVSAPPALPSHSAEQADHRHDLPAEPQTAREAIASSYAVLNEGERALFRRLAIFAGGWTTPAAATICPAGGSMDLAVPARLASLLKRGLICQPQGDGKPGEPRFVLFDTTHKYALEQLAATAEEALAVGRAHAAYYLQLAEQAEAEWPGASRQEWLARLERDQENLGAALAWARDHGADELGLRLASALQPYWLERGQLREAQRWLDELLARALPAQEVEPAAEGTKGSQGRTSGNLRTPVLAKALQAAGAVALLLGDAVRGEQLCAQSLQLYRQLDDSHSGTPVAARNARGGKARRSRQ
jgi:class 3 adenylate cyclase/transcriptional regulator with XRE-family HTH domain